MAKFKREASEQSEIMLISLPDHFNEDTHEYMIKDFIEVEVPEELFYDKYKNDLTGRKANHPKDILAAIIYGYYKGIHSSRRIEESLRNNIAFKFVSNKLELDHSSICDFKIKFQNVISGVFWKILYLLNEMDGIDFMRIVGDGTMISSSASKHLTVKGKGISKKLKQYEKLAKKLVERDIENEIRHKEEKQATDECKNEKKRIQRQKKKYNKILKQLNDYKDEVENSETDGEKSHNLSDPESELLVKEGGKKAEQGYNAKMMISNNDVILDVNIDGEHEKNSLENMVETVENLKEEFNNESKSKYLFDSNFFDIHKILELAEKGCEMYVDIKHRDFSKQSIKRKYFKIIKGDDLSLECVGGNRSKGYCYKDKKGKEWYHFNFLKSQCGECNNVSECFNNVKTGTKTIRFEKYEIDNTELIQAYRSKLKSEEGRKEYNRRIGKEHVFANFKTQKNHERSYYRGRSKVKTDLLLGAIAHNIGKYIKLLKAKRPEMVIA